MPGIAGIIGPRSVDSGVIDRMTRVMMHEAFYGKGHYNNLDVGVHIGWTCHEQESVACTPAWNPARDICVIFNGEEFSHAGAHVLHESMKPECAGSYVAALYEKMGTACLDKLNGRFSGVVVDLRKRVVVLFNDRYGLGRIYYHEEPGRFYFSSEAKSLLAILPAARRLDPTSVAETIACGSVMQNRTLFAGIALLPGGSAWSFTAHDAARKQTYFSPQVWEAQSPLVDEEFFPALRETFTRILPRYAGGAVAMSLTGGLDGRLIMAGANAPPGAMPCYSFCSALRECADVSIARRVASACRQPHQTIVVGGEFLANFPHLAEKSVFISDGTMDVTGSVELYVNRIARQIAPVRLTGNYGSEIVRGNVAFRPSRSDYTWLEPALARLVEEARATYLSERAGHKLSFIAFKQVPWHHYARLSVEQSQLTLRSPYLDNDLVSLMYRAPSSTLANKDPSLRLIHDSNADLARIPTDRGVVYRPAPVIGQIRRFCRNLTVKAEYAYDYGMPSWLARLDGTLRSLRLERLFLGRHKFYHFRIWYRGDLSGYLEDTLLDGRARQRPYLQPKALENLITDHVGGFRNRTLELHRALTLELVQQQLIECW